MSEKLILVTNDDGITAPGILFLSSIAKEFGRVCLVAPDKPQSGMGHAITINSTLRAHKTNHHKTDWEYACTGTPVDCVKFGVSHALHRKPDLVLSGINHGSNLSVNVIYSGTMSAAIEGAMEGIPSIGFSLCNFSIEADFSHCAKFVREIISKILSYKKESLCLNVNIPKLHADEIKGIKICRGAKSNWIEKFDERKDPYGNPYYWLTGELVNFEKDDIDNDLYYNEQGYVTVVPVQYDMTNHRQLAELKNEF